MLEIERGKPGRGPAGHKGQAWLLAGSAWKSTGEIAEAQCAGQSPGWVRGGRS